MKGRREKERKRKIREKEKVRRGGRERETERDREREREKIERYKEGKKRERKGELLKNFLSLLNTNDLVSFPIKPYN